MYDQQQYITCRFRLLLSEKLMHAVLNNRQYNERINELILQNEYLFGDITLLSFFGSPQLKSRCTFYIVGED